MFRADNEGERGQALVMVALLMTALLGLTGLVADIGWYELNMIRMQRAADAAALAGVVYLPTNVSGASRRRSPKLRRTAIRTAPMGSRSPRSPTRRTSRAPTSTSAPPCAPISS